MEKEKVLLGMSGGVDSSVAAYVLMQKGYEVIGATMRLWEGCATSNVDDAKKVCSLLGIEHYTLDYMEEFNSRVINNFLEEYKNARTPNPCVVCNKYLKFGRLLEEAKALGAKYIATGHYAKCIYNESTSRYYLECSNAEKKDQTYVLYNMTQDILSHTLFPLGDFNNKEEIREIAEKIGLVTAHKKDSQEICFIPDNDYSKFIEDRIGKFKSGNIVDINGNILGKHNGIINYTVGQRKGLGISNKTPLFVIKIDMKKNEVIVGEEENIYSSELTATNMNYIPFETPKEPLVCEAKIRYSSKAAPCTVYPLENGEAKVIFKDPQRAVTPGQSVVLYSEKIILGGGIIK